MKIQTINFKGKYIFPHIKTRKTFDTNVNNFVSVARYLTDKTKKRACVYKKTGLELRIIDEYGVYMERIANFFRIRFIKK